MRRLVALCALVLVLACGMGSGAALNSRETSLALRSAEQQRVQREALISLRRPAPTDSQLETAHGTRRLLADWSQEWVTPVVESFGAGEGGPLPVQTAIPVTFGQPVNLAQVEITTQIEPAVPLSVRWTSSQSLLIEPAPLAEDTGYEVKVGVFGFDGEALAITGYRFRTRPHQVRPVKLDRAFTLSFDDCGTPESIHAILNALDERGLKALFFPTGLCRDQYPWLVPELQARGHSVCNHTYSHPVLTRLSSAAVASEVARGVNGAGCNLLRPPYGAWDGPNGRIAAIAAAQGLRIQMWDVDTRDWAKTSTQYQLDQIRARGGMVLMHMFPGLHQVETILAL